MLPVRDEAADLIVLYAIKVSWNTPNIIDSHKITNVNVKLIYYAQYANGWCIQLFCFMNRA